MTSGWLRTWLTARPGVALLEDTTRLITRSSADIRTSLHVESALALHTCEESIEVDHPARMRAPSDQLDVVEGRDLEVDPPSVDRDHASGHPNLHSHRSGLEMLDADAGAHSSLARLELLANRPNRRRLEPVTEDRRRQHRHAGILEPIGTVFGPNNLLETPFPTHIDRPHRCHFTVKKRPTGGVMAERARFELANGVRPLRHFQCGLRQWKCRDLRTTSSLELPRS